jgi:hypothetical protein
MKLLTKILFSATLLIFVTGCNLKQPAPKADVDPQLPQVTNVKSIEDIDAIAFEWDTILHSNIQGYIIYRSNPDRDDNKLDEIARVNDKYSNHYVDANLKPNTPYSYRFAVYSNEQTRGNPGETINLKTMPMIESVSFIDAIQTLPRRAKIIWRPHTARNVSSYIVERKIPGREWEVIATVEGRLNAEYIDNDLEDNSVYHYRVKAKLYNGLVSEPSQTVTTQTKPLPPTVYNVTATNDQPKKIILEWNPVEMDDFAYYKVYRKRFFWSYHAKTDTNTFTDEFNDDGVERDYKVTVVDSDGLESLDSVVVKGTTLPQPQAPKIATVRYDEGGVFIQWYPNDGRTKRYILVKDGEVLVNGYENTEYFDRDVQPATEYKYSVYAVDEHNLVSDESERASILVPNLLQE